MGTHRPRRFRQVVSPAVFQVRGRQPGFHRVFHGPLGVEAVNFLLASGVSNLSAEHAQEPIRCRQPSFTSTSGQLSG